MTTTENTGFLSADQLGISEALHGGLIKTLAFLDSTQVPRVEKNSSRINEPRHVICMRGLFSVTPNYNNTQNYNECGTTACIAGYAAIASVLGKCDTAIQIPQDDNQNTIEAKTAIIVREKIHAAAESFLDEAAVAGHTSVLRQLFYARTANSYDFQFNPDGKQAAAALRDFLTTGTVDWAAAMAAPEDEDEDEDDDLDDAHDLDNDDHDDGAPVNDRFIPRP